MTNPVPDPADQNQKPTTLTYQPIADKWYDALLKKFPAGWKPDAKIFMYAGVGLLIFLGLIASTANPQKPAVTPPTQTSLAPTLPPNIDAENPVSTKKFISAKHGFSFEHPGLSGACCYIVGPTFGTVESIGNLSDPASVRRGADTPFNGLSLYIVELGNVDPNAYIKKESANLKTQYKAKNGQEPQNSSYQTLYVADQPTILLKNYNSLTVNRYYIKFPGENKLLYIGASEEKLGSFNPALSQILNSLTFDPATPAASPNPQP